MNPGKKGRREKGRREKGAHCFWKRGKKEHSNFSSIIKQKLLTQINFYLIICNRYLTLGILLILMHEHEYKLTRNSFHVMFLN